MVLQEHKEMLLSLFHSHCLTLEKSEWPLQMFPPVRWNMCWLLTEIQAGMVLVCHECRDMWNRRPGQGHNDKSCTLCFTAECTLSFNTLLHHMLYCTIMRDDHTDHVSS